MLVRERPRAQGDDDEIGECIHRFLRRGVIFEAVARQQVVGFKKVEVMLERAGRPGRGGELEAVREQDLLLVEEEVQGLEIGTEEEF